MEARARRRAATATILAGGEAAGASDSSAVAGGVASAITKEATQQTFLTGVQGQQNAFLAAQGREVKAQETANLWQTVGSISSSVGKASGGYEKIGEFFK